MTSTKHRVVIVGVSGRAGKPLAEALAETDKFEVIGTVRPSSAGNEVVKHLQAIGVDIRFIEWHTAPKEELEALFKGVDTVLSAANGQVLDEQTKLIDAAKAAGVKRFVPNDWATVCPPGIMEIEARKSAIHSYLQKIGLPYTSIDIGFWTQVAFPPKEPRKEGEAPGMTHYSYGPGNVKIAIVDRPLLGQFVAYIIEDPRTINRRVLAHHDEVTADEAWDLADKYSSYKLSEGRVKVSDEELISRLDSKDFMVKLFGEYWHSAYLRGDNNVETAKKLDFLVAKDLYPDVKVQTADEWAKGYYSG